VSRVAYLGPPGTYTEEAAQRYRVDAELAPYPTESAVVGAVEGGDAAEGVLAIENSIEGPVTRTVDALIHDSRLMIRHELVLAIEHCLIARPGTRIDDITEVRAHPQALNQCRKYIERRFPRARQVAALSNAAAVEEVLGVAGAAAIAGERAAGRYGGEVLERGIQDTPHNKTRFVVVASTDSEPSGRDKTSIAFTVAHDRPGTLVGVLHEFSDRAINLTKIESRPSREELGVYIFLVDLDGHRAEPTVAAALRSVEAKADFFRTLGSYPRSDDARDP
jgi:prephenate dehydratase